MLPTTINKNETKKTAIVCRPNETTLSAIREMEQMMKHPETVKTYDDAHKLLEACLREV